MQRFNYLPPTGRQRIVVVALAILTDVRLRSAILSITGALVLVAGMWLVQSYRLAAAERDDAFYTDAQRRSAGELRGVERIASHVQELTAIEASVDSIRRSGIRHESELASIGNQLPAGVWLAGITSQNGGWHIDGRSDRVGSVGAIMDALHGMRHVAATRLVSLHGADKTTGEPISYELDVDSKE